MLRDAAIALSLANLCLLRVWSAVLDPGGNFNYLKAPPSPTLVAAVLIIAVLLAGVVWGALRVENRPRHRLSRGLARALLVLFVLTALNSLFVQVALYLGPASRPAVLYFVVAALALVSLLAWPRWFVSTGKNLALILSPFVLLLCAQAGWVLATQPGLRAAYADQAPAPLLPVKNSPAPRLLWLVFDEMDQRLTFEQRPAGVELPEFDRLRRQALSASHAYPPAPWTTLTMPALISGRLVSEAKLVRADELLLTWNANGETVEWSSQANVFSQARELGFNSALVGVVIPYCRIIGESLTDCSWAEPSWWIFPPLEETFKEQLFWSLNGLVRLLPFADALGVTIGPSPEQIRINRWHKLLGIYRTTLDRTARLATRPELSLVLVHWPIPHPPGIYDRWRNDFSFDRQRNYLDNFELMDRTVGEIRAALERAHLWDGTTVLITGDHSWRPTVWRGKSGLLAEEEAFADRTDHRVPFVLKTAGQTESLAYDAPFNTVLSHDLVLALLRGEVSDPEGVVAWIDQRRQSGEGAQTPSPICGPRHQWYGSPPPDLPCE